VPVGPTDPSEEPDYISKAALDDGSSLAPAGTVFVVIRGMILAKDVPVALAEVPMAFNQDMKAVIPGPKVHPSFLLYALIASKQQLFRRIGRSAHGTMTLMSHDIAEHCIPLPPLAEQRNVAKVLRLVHQAIEHQERLLLLTYELKKALLHHLFPFGLRGEARQQTEIGLMPRSWSPVPLSRCCHVATSSLAYTDFLAAPESKDADAVPSMAVKVSDMNIHGNEKAFVVANAMKSLPVALARRKLVPRDAIVFPKRGAAIATNKKRMTTTWTSLDPNLIAVCAGESLEPDFLHCWFQTFDLRRITAPGPTPQLNKKDLLPLLVPVPSDLGEQREIAALIECVDKKARLHHKKKSLLRRICGPEGALAGGRACEIARSRAC
jgi:restriction endonuclease S subunit